VFTTSIPGGELQRMIDPMLFVFIGLVVALDVLSYFVKDEDNQETMQHSSSNSLRKN
jgi:hypothetical protein